MENEAVRRTSFSVAMSIYKDDVPEFLETALDSIIIDQTLKPDEVVIVGDGPLPEALVEIVEKEKQKIAQAALPVEIVFLPQAQNRGLGAALGIACEACRYPYIARMDSDDISKPDRFEKEMKMVWEHPELSVVGGMITEFVGSPENVVSQRDLPLTNDEIYRFLHSRSGLNHVTVVLKRDDVLRVGNYNGRFRQEDYYLWARMMKAGCKMANIPDVVVNVRSGEEQFARRGSLKYFHQHMDLFRYMYHEHLISWTDLMRDYLLRFAQAVFPGNMRNWIYVHFLRKK